MNKNQKVIIGIACAFAVVIIIAAVVFAFIFLGGGNTKKSDNKSASSKQKEYAENDTDASQEEATEDEITEEETTEATTEITTEATTTEEATTEATEEIDNVNSGIEENYDDSEYILPDSDSRYLDMSDLEGFTAYECRLARNELFARHGRLFDDDELQAYFDSKSWYDGYIAPEDFDDSVFNKYELANRDLIVKYEEEQGYR